MQNSPFQINIYHIIGFYLSMHECVSITNGAARKGGDHSDFFVYCWVA